MTAQGARLITDSGIEIPLIPGTSTVGRPDHSTGWSPTIDLTPMDPNHKSSRRHAEIKLHAGTIVVRDLGAANKTYINGQPLEPQRDYPLSEGDMVAFGEVRLRLEGLTSGAPGVRCPKCDEPVTPDMAVCASCGANLRYSTMTISVGPAHACFRCGRPTRTGEHCAECAEAVAEADRELLALSGLKRKK